MTTILSYDNSPRLSLPLPFHLTAAAFGMAAGVWLAFSPDAWGGNRWNPQLLALTHLVTIGVLGHAMVGSLLQLLPVVAGVAVPGGRLAAWGTLGGMTSGTLLLVSGLSQSSPPLLIGGGAVLLGAVLAITTLMTVALWRSPASDGTLRALRLAPLSFAAVAVLGALLVAILTLGLRLPLLEVLHLHVAWGAVGWVFMLIVGVGFTVVPMFQVTPPYPQKFTRSWAIGVGTALCGLALALTLSPTAAVWIDAVLALILLAASGGTLYVQHKSRRPHDVTRRFWQGAMLCWSLAATLWILRPWLPETIAPFFDWWLFVLAFVGGGMGALNGMLFKIVPFLGWLHIKNQLPRRSYVPTMQEFIAERWQRAHGIAFAASVALLLVMPVVPGLGPYAGALFATQQAGLLLLLVLALRVYTRTVAAAKG